jgi:hypothetical protein
MLHHVAEFLQAFSRFSIFCRQLHATWMQHGRDLNRSLKIVAHIIPFAGDPDVTASHAFPNARRHALPGWMSKSISQTFVAHG